MDFAIMKEFMDRLTAWRIPGNSIRIYKGKEEVFSYSSGYSDLEQKIPMNGTEHLNIYSCSKVATVTAALQLFERGYFLMNDPISEFLPAFKTMYIDRGNGETVKAENPITMKHLFTMTSGLTYNMQTKAFDKAREQTGGKMDTLTVLNCIAEEPISFEPGTAWQYSLSHDVLAGVVEVISGKKFSTYMKENIFEPLEMHDTCYHNAGVQDKMAEQYQFVDSEETDLVKLQMSGSSREGGTVINIGKGNMFEFGPDYDSGGAGITTTVPDYSKFACALGNWGEGANGERILSKSTVELLRTNQLTEDIRKPFANNQYIGYGYGLGVRTMLDKAEGGSSGNLKEFGWGGAAGATVTIDPDSGFSLFYAHHMMNPQETYYQPRLRNVLYTCMTR